MSTSRNAESEAPRGRISIAALLLVAAGAFVIGAGIEAAPHHSVLLVAGAALLLCGHVAGSYPVLAGSHRGNETFPAAAAAIAALATTAGWAEARYGLHDARPWIIAVVAIAVFGVAPWLAALSTVRAKIPALLTFRSAAATELATLGVATWATARGVTTELDGDTSWRLFATGGALVLGVFALPLCSSAYERRITRRAGEPAHTTSTRTTSAREPLGDRFETWITALVRILAAALAAGVGYILWLDYHPGDGLIPLLIAGGALLFLALLGDRLLKVTVKAGTSGEVTVELSPKSVWPPPPLPGDGGPKSPPPTTPAAVLPSLHDVTADMLDVAFANPFPVRDFTRQNRLVRAASHSSPVLIVGEKADLEAARARGTLLHHAYTFADDLEAAPQTVAEPPTIRITAAVDQIGDAVRSALAALNPTEQL